MKPQSSPSAVTAARVQRRPTGAELAERAARRQAAEADAHAQAGRAARHLMDICDAIRPPRRVTLRDEPTMAEAVAELRTRGPQPPLDYARRPPLLEKSARVWAWYHPTLISIAFLAGVIIGMGF